MELYKFISETEIKKYKGGFVVIDNRIYTNPAEEMIKKAGYKELFDAPIPQFDEATQYVETAYVNNEDFISAVYKVREIPVENEIVK